MQKYVFLLMAMVAGLWIGGCPEDSNGPQRMKVDPDDIPAACAAYTACSNHMISFGTCNIVIDTARFWDTTANSFEMGTNLGETWINSLAGVQNTACMAEISGGTCDEVLACANQGKSVIGCTPKEGYFGGRYCSDEEILRACTPTGVDGGAIESSVRCADLGMICLEIERGGERFASCGYQADDNVEGISVTCQGNIARIQAENVYFTYDCDLMNANCRAGSYTSWENYAFCVTNRPVCDQETMEPFCDGTLKVSWCNGREIGFDCSQYGQKCQDTQLLLWNLPLCIYPDNSCNPYSFQEECQDGIITYCGPSGITTYDCKQHGYSGCTLQTLFAHCQARDGG